MNFLAISACCHLIHLQYSRISFTDSSESLHNLCFFQNMCLLFLNLSSLFSFCVHTNRFSILLSVFKSFLWQTTIFELISSHRNACATSLCIRADQHLFSFHNGIIIYHVFIFGLFSIILHFTFLLHHLLFTILSKDLTIHSLLI